MSLAEHFDPESLDMLREVMDDEFSDLMRVYIDDSRQRLPLLTQALQQQDARQLRELAHSFKGASSNVSANALAQLCFQLEMAAREGQLQGAEELIAQIEAEYLAVETLLQDML
ncbi:Hpt domain-containing protein [Thalassolituus hydrocarboniclasticus]|uniref:Hpt domain-containing protein n=2 Tax=Thalassolituus hydrocarboniclasticus TaxID=2742796 RepID=A0ABY6AJF2_9GAMM|nr:Hpt domain-containing protein [Thalassolituus hydrocarboniclasticus]